MTFNKGYFHSPHEFVQTFIKMLAIKFCFILPYLVHCNHECANATFNLYSVTAFNDRERSLLYFFNMKNHMVKFLNEITKEAVIPMRVLVDGYNSELFEQSLQYSDIEYNFMNVRDYTIIAEPTEIITANTDLSERFLNWDEIEQWVTIKERRHPILKKIVLGNTYEKRELFVLKLSSGKNEPAVFLMGGEEGRDWHSPAILLYFVNDILRNNSGLQNLLDLYDIYVLPVFNPDGYEYSMTHDRFWKKNRKVLFPDQLCSNNMVPIGVNIDRNWYISGDSVENAECDPVYIGHQPLSEVEPRTVAEYLNNLAPNLMAFVNLRGFHRLILLPYAHYTDYTSNNAMLIEMLTSTCEKLQENFNATYYYGNTASFLFNATGNCADWVKNKLNVPIVYTVYTRYKDYFVPQTRHTYTLKNQFIEIMKKTLILAHSIYRPLFNGQDVSTINKAFVVLSITLAWEYHNHICIFTYKYIHA